MSRWSSLSDKVASSVRTYGVVYNDTAFFESNDSGKKIILCCILSCIYHFINLKKNQSIEIVIGFVITFIISSVSVQ